MGDEEKGGEATVWFERKLYGVGQARNMNYVNFGLLFGEMDKESDLSYLPSMYSPKNKSFTFCIRTAKYRQFGGSHHSIFTPEKIHLIPINGEIIQVSSGYISMQ